MSWGLPAKRALTLCRTPFQVVDLFIKKQVDRERVMYIQKHFDFSACQAEHLKPLR